MVQSTTEGVHRSLSEHLSVYAQGLPGVLEQFGESIETRAGGETVDVQTGIKSCNRLLTGGKMVRGTLVMAGHALLGGTNSEAALVAAGAMEAFQASLLTIDDVQDEAETRRGIPAVHIDLRDHFMRTGRKSGEAMKLGQDTAILAALAVEHHAQEALYEVRAEPERVVQVARVLNHMLHETALGQIRDITGDRRTLTPDGSLRTALLKTSRYTIVAPLQIGAILAGATKPDLDKLEAYGDPAGLAFQMHDDILGVFGDLDKTGKPPTDIHEGKLTWMMLTALQRTVGKEHRTLKRSLGNKNLGKKQFETCRAIVRECGALDETKKLVSTLAHDALTALEITPAAWKDEPLQLLRAMPRSFMR